MFTKLQRFMPQHFLSRLAGSIANCKHPKLRDWTINFFLARYDVNLAETPRQTVDEYSCFNDFFTRTLNPDARKIDPDLKNIVSPVDGYISQIGAIDNTNIIQAKKHQYSLKALLANDTDLIAKFSNGSFATIYLAPHNYHRIHCPMDATLEQMIYVPGKLFSVNTKSVAHIPGLFARNERVIIIFNTAVGKMAVVLVGATFVGSIATSWSGVVTPNQYKKPYTWNYKHLSQNPNMKFTKGTEIARFLFGSTAILLFENNKIAWDPKYQAEEPIELGECIAENISS